MTDTSDYARRIDEEIRRSYMRHLHQIENEYAVIENAIAIIKHHMKPHHHWVADRLAQVKNRAVKCEMLLAQLSGAEAAYRYVHDCEGDGASLVVGRAWDQMRRIGDEARSFLGTENDKTERE